MRRILREERAKRSLGKREEENIFFAHFIRQEKKKKRKKKDVELSSDTNFSDVLVYERCMDWKLTLPLKESLQDP